MVTEPIDINVERLKRKPYEFCVHIKDSGEHFEFFVEGLRDNDDARRSLADILRDAADTLDEACRD